MFRRKDVKIFSVPDWSDTTTKTYNLSTVAGREQVPINLDEVKGVCFIYVRENNEYYRLISDTTNDTTRTLVFSGSNKITITKTNTTMTVVFSAGADDIHETDTTLTLSGVPADAKATGNAIGEIKDDIIGTGLLESSNHADLWESGSISTSVGTNGPSDTRMRTKGYVDDTVTLISVTDGYVIVHAYNSDTYIGHYNGSGFDKETTVVSYRQINLSTLRKTYPNYEYRLVWYKSSSYNVNPVTDYVKIIYNTSIVKSINDIQDKIDEIETKQNEFIGNYSTNNMWESGQIGYTNGNTGTSQSRMRTKTYIPSDASYIIAQRGLCYVYAYDSSDNFSFVGTWRGTEFTTDSETSNIAHKSVNLSTVKVAHPEYVYRVAWYLTSNYTPTISKDYASVQILNQNSLIVLSSSLKKSTIVNMGDSIFGLFNAPTDISTYLSYGTGATVYNCAFGGTRLVTRTPNTANAAYFDFTTLVDAIISGDYTAQDTAVLTADPDVYSEHLAVLKTVDFNNVNLLTLAYGTNDYTGDVEIGTVGNSDATTFIGALHEVITKLHTAFPKMRIVLCTPIFRMYHADNNYTNADIRENTNNDTLIDFVDAIKTAGLADYVEVIDNHYIGINSTNWQSYLADGTHPNEDGRNLIARNMLKNIY